MDKRRTSNRSGSSRYARKSQGIKNPERQYRSENPKVIRKRQQKKLKQQKTKRWMRYGIFTAIMFLVILLGILRVSRLFQVPAAADWIILMKFQKYRRQKT